MEGDLGLVSDPSLGIGEPPPAKVHMDNFCRSAVPRWDIAWAVVSGRLQEKPSTNKTSPLPKNPLVMNPGARYDLKSH